MPVSVTMPRLGESVSEGTVTRWLKKAGDQVEADEPLLEVSTDKVDTEIPAPASGVLAEIKVGEDETVEVGVELAVIDDAGGGAGATGGPQEQASPEASQAEAETAEAEEPEEAEEAEEAEAQPIEAEAAAAQRQWAQQPQQQPEQPRQPERPAGVAEAAATTDSGEPQGELAAGPAQREQVAAEAGAGEQPAAASGGAPAGPASGDGQGPAYVTPLVRKLAAERGVDLSTVRGSGIGGRIRKQDVLEAARADGTAAPAGSEAPARGGEPTTPMRTQPSAPPVPARGPAAPAAQPSAAPSQAGVTRAAGYAQARGTTEQLSRLRKVIASRMVESLQVSAQLTTVVEADVTRIARLRSRAKAEFEAREGVRLSFLPFFTLAAVEALKAHPAVNSSIDMDAGAVTYHEAVHLGIAVDTERGLLVPVIHDAQDLNLGGLARKIADLADRTRAGQVSPDELGGGTFTVTNTGSRGALFDTPIINQPQVGILGTGAVVKRPVVIDDPDLGETIAVRSMVYLALTYDHRIVDGADAARFLNTVKARLEEGNFDSELGL